MNPTENKKIGQIVAEDYRTAQVFHHYNINFCCAGAKDTIEEACEKGGVAPENVYDDLGRISEQGTQQDNYNTWPIDFLTDYLSSNSHASTRGKIPEIDTYAQKVAKVHGGRHPEMIKVSQLFSEASESILSNFENEENLLFPYIKKITEEKIGEEDRHHGDSAQDLIEMLQKKQVLVEDKVEQIRSLTQDYIIPEDACATYSILLQNLAAFDQDTRKRIHLKSNILFPKTLALEKQIH